MNYEITYHNDFSGPYYCSNDTSQCRHIHTESYIVKTLDEVKQIVKDFLDVPADALTLDEILDDFQSSSCHISIDEANKIRDYYNGRLSLWKKIDAELDMLSQSSNIDCVYDIPSKINDFAAADTASSIQNSAFISIKTTSVSISAS